MFSPVSSSTKLMEQAIAILEHISGRISTGEKLQEQTQIIIAAAEKLKGELRSSEQNVLALAEMVHSKLWESAMVALENNFPAASKELVVEQVVCTIFKDQWRDTSSAIKWLRYLDAKLRPMACEKIHELIKDRRMVYFDDLLLLHKVVKELSINIGADLATTLDIECHIPIENLVKAIRTKSYYDERFHTVAITNYHMPSVLSCFDVSRAEDFWLLVAWAENFEKENLEVCLEILSSIQTALEEFWLDGSELSMNLWAYVKEFTFFNNKAQPLLDKFTKEREQLFLHYQRYLEQKDKHKIFTLHRLNPKLHWIVDEFVGWYYDAAQPSRTHYLLETAAHLDSVSAAALVKGVALEMFRGQHCFDALCLFNIFQSTNDPLIALPDVWTSVHMIKAPDTVLHLFTIMMRMRLQPFLQLRNKRLQKMTMGVQQQQVVCSETCTAEEQLWNVSVDPKSALTTISFWDMQLDAYVPFRGLTMVESKGTQWRIHAVDKRYVKILNEQGNMLDLKIYFPHLLTEA
jgi:hypothetical protein